ncbi:hypothetical protein BGZ63DRAFT_406634 [Mariannaea sp. PMI_226]|nr:hypothetical protein BGZ63DRAFT_406634 [Mariannaea sp. PMI_226]
MKLLSALAVVSGLMSSAEAGWFYYQRCLCDTHTQVFNYHVGYFPKGSYTEQTKSSVAVCIGKNNPSACSGFDLTNVCGDTYDPGLGNLCYDQNLLSGDIISVNGQSFNVNNYQKEWYTKDSQNQESCTASCYNADKSRFLTNAGAFGVTIKGLPDFHADW